MAANKKSVLCGAVIGLLLLVIGIMAYKFIIAGKTTAGADGRVAILLEPGERTLVLKEMRQFLEATQAMTDALTRDDLQAFAKAAKPMGMAASRNAPASLVGKLPIEFKTLGFSVHDDFDRMALDAESLGDSRHSLSQLSATLQKCVACHKTYQLAAGPSPQPDK